MRVLITGATGMIGRVTATTLARRAEVWTTSRTPIDSPTHLVADLTELRDVERLATAVEPDAVIHLAGETGRDEAALHQGNVVATQQLLSTVSNTTRIIVVGSAAEYGDHQQDLIDETDATRPVTAYGRSKLAQTEAARSIAAKRAIQLTIARPFNVVGPDLPTSTAIGNATERIRTTARGGHTTLTVGRTDIVRDWVPVRFVADALATMALSSASSGVYNICTGVGHRLDDVFDAIARSVGVDVDLITDPTLAALPAVDCVVGAPHRLETDFGLRCAPSVDDIAAAAW
ncbi:MAG: NAD(P)-dependent oxidoreductase [Acidimicrobiia bacterium]|nr:NAD(P)-dependent oxidoreductase [Acidimicrobiia bacterium]